MLMLRIVSMFCIAVLLTRAPWLVVQENPLWFLSITVFVIALGLAVGKVLLKRKFRLPHRCVHIEQNLFDVAIRYVGHSDVSILGFTWDGPEVVTDGEYHLHVSVSMIRVNP